MLTTDQSILLPLGPTARRLRVPSTWLRGEAEAGRVPALRVGRTFFFDPDAVQAILLERARRIPRSVAEGVST